MLGDQHLQLTFLPTYQRCYKKLHVASIEKTLSVTAFEYTSLLPPGPTEAAKCNEVDHASCKQLPYYLNGSCSTRRTLLWQLHTV